MKALSFKQAQSCEMAVGPKCTCRCGGAFHGASRISDVRQLPLDDLHCPTRLCPRCRGLGEQPWWTPEKGTTLRRCMKCKGKGRYLTRNTKNAPLPVEVEA